MVESKKDSLVKKLLTQFGKDAVNPFGLGPKEDRQTVETKSFHVEFSSTKR